MTVGFTPPATQVPPGPFSHGAAITPSDSAALPGPTRAVYVGGAGDLCVVLAGDSASVTFKSVPVGTTLNICAGAVKAAGTTATNLIALT